MTQAQKSYCAQKPGDIATRRNESENLIETKKTWKRVC